MGFTKFLNLDLFHSSCFPGQQHAAHDATIKLVTSDGQVKTYTHSVHVAKIMEDFPKHLVCRSDEVYIGRKIPALAENERLQPGNNYFILPNHFFQSVLTFVNVASFVASRSGGGVAHGSPGKPAACRPFDILRTPSGSLRIHVSDEFISRLVEEEEEEEEEEKGQRARLCSTPQLEKDYVRLVEGSRSGRWKPKLETINESRRERKKRRTYSGCRNTISSATAAAATTSKPLPLRCKSRSRK